MKVKTVLELAKEYDFNTKEEYFDYIILSVLNGQRQQCIKLFNQMQNPDKLEFLTEYIEPATNPDLLKIILTEVFK